MLRQFHGFDQSIRGATGYTQNRSYIFETLVVQAVDLDNGLTKDLGETRPFFDLHFMNKNHSLVTGVGMVEGIGQLVRDVRVQGPTEGDVDHLASAADAEEGFAI